MRIVVLLLILFCTTLCQADEPSVHFKRLGVEQGMSQNSTFATVKDRQGFLWFATQDGLNRYDGYEFKTFRHDPANPGSISDNNVNTVLLDSKGVLWAGTHDGGLNRYEQQTEQFTRFSHIASDPASISHNNVRAIFEDSQGRLWLGTAGGLNRFDTKNQRFVRFVHKPGETGSLSHDLVTTIGEDTNGGLWVGTFGGGLNRFDEASKRFIHFRFDAANPYSLASDNVWVVYFDQQDNLWVGTFGGGLNQLDSKTGQFVRLGGQAVGNSVWSVYQDNQAKVWIGSNTGLTALNSSGKLLRNYRHQSADPLSLSADVVRSIYQDDSSAFWIGTFGGGVNRIDPHNQPFVHFKHNPQDARSLSNNVVISFVEDNQGSLWVGTYDGLNRYHPQSGEFDRYRHESAAPGSLSHNVVISLINDSRGAVWAGTSGGGLNRYDEKRNQFSHYRHNKNDPNSLSSDTVNSIIEDRKGRLWVATSGGGLNLFDGVNGRFKHYRHDKNNPNSLSSDHLTSLFEDPSGQIWVGSIDGLNRLDPDSGMVEQFHPTPSVPRSLSHSQITFIHQDSSSRLWVGTHGGGLNLYDPQINGFIHYREKDGLANDMVYGILEDDQGLLWLSGNRGLDRFDPVAKTFKNYDINDGLQNNEFNVHGYYRTADGELLFGGIGGFNRFYPADIKPDGAVKSVVFTEFSLFNQPVSIGTQDPRSDGAFRLEKDLNHLSQLSLTYQQSLVSFKFSALHYNNPNKVQYAYRMDGLDQDWIYTDSQNRRATYTNIPPGSYTLRVKARFKQGQWDNSGRALQITVTPPWWKTTLAYGCYGLLLVGGLLAFYRYRTHALIQKATELEHAVVERTETINRMMAQKEKMFANISHEFKTPLTLILNPLASIEPSHSAAQIGSKLAMMKRNGQRLLRMVEQLLELSRLDSSQPQSRHNYSLVGTLNMLLTSFSPLLESKKLTLNQTPFDDVVLSMTADSLEMILNNLLSNAIKYTPNNGEITVTVIAATETVDIEVKDNGPGISDENKALVFNRFTRADDTHHEKVPGAGVGLALVKELVEANQGSISLTSKVGQGSTFAVTLPMAENQKTAEQTVTELSATTLMEVDILEQPQVPLIHSEPDDNTVSKTTLLLVDDNPDMLALLTETLSPTYQLLTALDGEQALKTAMAQLPDLIVSDVMMPGIDGFELLKRLKQDALTNHIPVVLLTAKGELEDRLTGWAERADEYLHKPFNSHELLHRIDNLLAIRSLLQHRYQQQTLSQVPKTNQDSKKQTTQTPDKAQSLNEANQAFVEQLNTVLEKCFADETLDVAQVAGEMAISPRQLNRKVNALLDLSPKEYVRTFRMNKAAQMLREGTTPSVVAYSVGFSSHSYFSQCFKARFDCLPSHYV